MRNITIGVAAAVLIWSFAYAFAARAPLAVQRVVSVLPGVPIDSQARQDGESTMEGRRMLRKIGMEMIPNYLWVGRGFGLDLNDSSVLWDPTTVTMHANAGRFFNGFIGLMVNTGLFGTVFMGGFLLGGGALAWRIIKYLRTHGCEDNFTRLCAVLSAWWVCSAIAFLFLHGDSEYAMKTFSVQAGMLLACERCLDKRLAAAAASAVE
jgi:O-antigen ligase